MLKAGIVGLPNVGKSTLFNVVTRTRKAEAANQIASLTLNLRRGLAPGIPNSTANQR
jgi:ribosome biogenesis GTPase A